MTLLSLFGLFSVSLMMLCYTFEKHSHWFVLGFATACGLGSLYGFLQGAWPFGIVEGVWAIIAFNRWIKTKTRKGLKRLLLTTLNNSKP